MIKKKTFLLTKIIGKNLENLWVMAGSLIIGGIVMWIVDDIYEHKRQVWIGIGHDTETMEHMSIAQSIWIGACQILSAVFPGTSRSMSTIAAGQSVFFFSSRRRHTRWTGDWSSDVCSSDLSGYRSRGSPAAASSTAGNDCAAPIAPRPARSRRYWAYSVSVHR